MILRLWFLVILACAGALAPSRAQARGAENRTWDFFPTATETRPQSAPQVADSHLGNLVCGYELAPGYAQAAETAGPRLIGSADSAGRRGLSRLGNEGAVFPTNAAARAKAAELGYNPVRQVPFNSHGQQVFKSGNRYITRDVDSHSGGAWKVFDQQGRRLGTYGEDLTTRIGP